MFPRCTYADGPVKNRRNKEARSVTKELAIVKQKPSDMHLFILLIRLLPVNANMLQMNCGGMKLKDLMRSKF